MRVNARTSTLYAVCTRTRITWYVGCRHKVMALPSYYSQHYVYSSWKGDVISVVFITLFTRCNTVVILHFCVIIPM